MDFAIESVRRLVTQVPGWQLGLLGGVAVFALWMHKIVHLLATLTFALYAWLTYQYAMLGFDTLGQQTGFGILIGGGVIIATMLFYYFFIHNAET